MAEIDETITVFMPGPIKELEYKDMLGIWKLVNYWEHDILLTTYDYWQDHPALCFDSSAVYAYKDRLCLRIDGGPEFEIEDIRVPGLKSYQDAMKESHLCPK